jgi:folate-binding protein YgfZ
MGLKRANAMSTDEADAHRLRDGLPLIPKDCGEETVNPLELNILSALSFDKGCYLGQEVVSRVHRLGRTTRRLVRIESTSGGAQSLPEKLALEESLVVRLTSIARVGDLEVGLALLKRKIEDGPLLVDELKLEISSIQEN